MLTFTARFLMNFHLIQSLNLRNSQLLASGIVSKKIEVSTAFRFPENLTHWRGRRRDAILYRPATRQGVVNVALGLLVQAFYFAIGDAATMRARSWCFTLCEDSGVKCMLLQRYLNANCTNTENTRTSFAKKIAVFLLFGSRWRDKFKDEIAQRISSRIKQL